MEENGLSSSITSSSSFLNLVLVSAALIANSSLAAHSLELQWEDFTETQQQRRWKTARKLPVVLSVECYSKAMLLDTS